MFPLDVLFWMLICHRLIKKQHFMLSSIKLIIMVLAIWLCHSHSLPCTFSSISIEELFIPVGNTCSYSCIRAIYTVRHRTVIYVRYCLFFQPVRITRVIPGKIVPSIRIIHMFLLVVYTTAHNGYYNCQSSCGVTFRRRSTIAHWSCYGVTFRRRTTIAYLSFMGHLTTFVL